MHRASGASINPGFRSLCTADQQEHFSVVDLIENFLANPRIVFAFQSFRVPLSGDSQTGHVAGSDAGSQCA